MRKSSTNKYTIEFSGYETLNSIPIKLSEKDFKNHKREYDKKVEETKEEDEFKVEYRKYEHDRKTYTQINHFYTIGTSDIILTEMHCKENYKFV